jgi:hypothetical protein
LASEPEQVAAGWADGSGVSGSSVGVALASALGSVDLGGSSLGLEASDGLLIAVGSGATEDGSGETALGLAHAAMSARHSPIVGRWREDRGRAAVPGRSRLTGGG